MWQIRKVNIDNLFRFEHAVFEPLGDSTSLIIGQNDDDPGADSNGAGKSSLFDAVTWAIWGRVPRGGTIDSIIRREAPAGTIASVELTLFDSETNSSICITRMQGRSNDKSRDSLKFQKIKKPGEQDNKPLRIKTLTQEAICKFFGYDGKHGFDDYLSRAYFSSTSSRGFLSSEVGPSARQAVLERYLGLEVIDKALSLARTDAKEIQTSRDALFAKAQSFEEMIATIPNRERLVAEKVDHETEIADCQTAVTRYQNAVSILSRIQTEWMMAAEAGKDFNRKHQEAVIALSTAKLRYEDVKESEGYYLELRESYPKVVEEDRSLLRAISEKQGEKLPLSELMNTVQSALLSKNRELNETRSLISQHSGKELLTCPHCSGPLIFDSRKVLPFDTAASENRLLELRQVESALANEIAVCERELSELREQISTIGLAVKGFESQRVKLQKTISEVDSHNYTEADSLNSKIAECDLQVHSRGTDYERWWKEFELSQQEWIKQLTEIVKEMTGKVLSNGVFDDLAPTLLTYEDRVRSGAEYIQTLEFELQAVNSKLERLDQYENSLKTCRDEVAVLNNKVSSIEWWIENFPKVKRRVLDRFIPLFQQGVNGYLERLQIKERVKFSLEVEKKSGSGMKAGFFIGVFDGDNWAPFESYSGGEKSRILVSVGFALRDLSARSSNGLGFLLCDEILDTLDSTGIEYFFNLVTGLEGQKMVITHTKSNDIVSRCDSVYVVKRRDGVSEVIDQRRVA